MQKAPKFEDVPVLSEGIVDNFPFLLLPVDMTMRNSFISEEEFQTELIRILTSAIGCPSAPLLIQGRMVLWCW